MAGSRHRNAHTVDGNAYVSGDIEVGGDIVADDITADVATAATVAATDITLANDLTVAEAGNVILGTTTGTKIGTATDQKLGFYNATPVVQPTAYTQTFSTADKTHAARTSAATATTAATNVSPYGYSQAQADAIVTNLNAVRADLADTAAVLNSLIDDLQALGLIG